MSQKRSQKALRSTQSNEHQEPGIGGPVAGGRLAGGLRRFDVLATLLIAVLAFILSYSKLTDLAARSGYSESMAHLWPLIVDGLAVVATRGVLSLQSGRWYAWTLLVASTGVSVVAAVASAMFPAGPLPPVAAALVSVVPALCLLAAPHLAVLLMRVHGVAPGAQGEPVAGVEPVSEGAAGSVAEGENEPVAVTHPQPVAPDAIATVAVEANESVADVESEPVADVESESVAPSPVAQPEPEHHTPHLFAVPPTRRVEALSLIAEGWSQRAVAKHIGVSDTTIRRWRQKAS